MNNAYNNIHDIETRFHTLFSDNDQINLTEVLLLLLRSGLREDDPRLRDFYRYLREAGHTHIEELPLEQIQHFKDDTGILDKVLCGRLIIPDFLSFTDRIADIFYDTRGKDKGHLPTYIPQLSRVDPNRFGLSLCTVDGQRFSLGDAHTSFALQSASKPVTYALALEQLGSDQVHQHVGREPSGAAFNGLILNQDGLPHNPMINAGAIMTSALVSGNAPIADKFDLVVRNWGRLTASKPPGIDNGMFLSEKATADRNYALCYLMRECKAFPPGVNIQEVIDLYLQCCSIEMTCEQLSVAAATLANSGLNPLTNDRVFTVDTVKNTLSLMSCCGMYDFSGEFFFKVGVPTKSGVSGVLMVIIPNVMGMAIYSPRLDHYGNSFRGVEFCKQLVEVFNFHNFDGITRFSHKIDPARRDFEVELEKSILLGAAASRNSVAEIKRLAASGIELDLAGYDGRTPLHYAADHGALDVLRFLIDRGLALNCVDRWGNTPLDDARKANRTEAVEVLEAAGASGSSESGSS